MDAFAAAVCAGLGMKKFSPQKALVIGLYFGIFQAVMPLLGYLAASVFTATIIAYDHWIAFVLLCFLGGNMIVGSFKKDGGKPDEREVSVKPAHMLPLAIATSIDALAVGVSFSLLRVNIIPAVTVIGLTTLILSMIGVKIGNVFGLKFKAKAEFAGGAILVLIGLKILLDHLGVLSFGTDDGLPKALFIMVNYLT
jgi:putative Mn2+ efflux pump MntP